MSRPYTTCSFLPNAEQMPERIPVHTMEYSYCMEVIPGCTIHIPKSEALTWVALIALELERAIAAEKLEAEKAGFADSSE